MVTEIADKPAAHKDAPQHAQAAALSRQTTDSAALNTPGKTAHQPEAIRPDGTMDFSATSIYGKNSHGLETTVAAAQARPAEVAAPQAPGRPGDVQRAGNDALPKPSDTLASGVNPADVAQSKEKLEHAIAPDRQKEFQEQMNTIEHRNPPLTADQINQIYDKTTQLLTNPDNTSQLNQAERTQLASSMLKDIAHPNETDQGFHNTCNVTTLEKRLNAQDPVKFANMVTEVGLTGQYTAPDGKAIKLDAASLHPDAEAGYNANDSRTDGARNYASQIFDVATINEYWQHQQPPLSYSQVRPTGQGDTGERLTYPNGQEVKGPDGKPMRSPGLSTEAMGQIGKDLGMSGQYIISNAATDGPNNGAGTDKVENIDQFNAALAASKPPAIIMVNAGNLLFSGSGEQPDGWHVVTASNYKEGPPAMVFMSNQWGEKNDKWVSVADLYSATLPNNAPGGGGRRDDGGQGDGGQGQGGGQRGDGGQGQGGGQRGWSRNDEVIRDEPYREWRQDLFDNYWKHSDQNPLNNPQNQNKPVDVQTQVSPLKAMLADAASRQDDIMMQVLNSRINDIMAGGN